MYNEKFIDNPHFVSKKHYSTESAGPHAMQNYTGYGSRWSGRVVCFTGSQNDCITQFYTPKKNPSVIQI